MTLVQELSRGMSEISKPVITSVRIKAMFRAVTDSTETRSEKSTDPIIPRSGKMPETQ